MAKLRYILLLVVCATALSGRADEALTDSIAADSVTAPKKSGLWARIIDYFDENEVEREENARKRFTVSFIGGPSYSSTTKLSLGAAGVLNYRLPGGEYPSKPSVATITGSLSTAKFWELNLVNTTIFNDDSHHLNLEARLRYMPLNFWGMGYDMCDNDDNKSEMKELKAKIKLEWMFRLADHLFLGPAIAWDYDNTGDMTRPELLDGQDQVVRNYGLGLTMEYDTRDFVTGPTRGVYAYCGVLSRPKFLWNHYYFTTLDLRTCYYHTAWRGAIIAGEVHALFNFGSPSWGMMARMGDIYSMRGYYEGRYRDNHMITAQVELRQRVYKRSGIVVWVGCGNVFHDSDSFKHILPNYGLGYRFAFREHTNIRLDYGFGKCGQSGFMFSINEAF